jgi:hypothetical protein
VYILLATLALGRLRSAGLRTAGLSITSNSARLLTAGFRFLDVMLWNPFLYSNLSGEPMMTKMRWQTNLDIHLPQSR